MFSRNLLSAAGVMLTLASGFLGIDASCTPSSTSLLSLNDIGRGLAADAYNTYVAVGMSVSVYQAPYNGRTTTWNMKKAQSGYDSASLLVVGAQGNLHAVYLVGSGLDPYGHPRRNGLADERIITFDKNGTETSQITSASLGRSIKPSALAFSQDFHRLYMGDELLSGGCIWSLGLHANGSLAEQAMLCAPGLIIAGPKGVAVDNQGFVYVGTWELATPGPTGRPVKISSAGKVVSAFNTSSVNWTSKRLGPMAVDSTQQLLYVIDGRVIVVLTTQTGAQVGELCDESSSPFTAIAIDSQGRVLALRGFATDAVIFPPFTPDPPRLG